MAAGESLSPYDDITSDELFDSFMDVVSSVEQSFHDEDQSKLSENPYEDINDINGMIAPDINISCKNNEPSQFSNLLPSNDPIHLPLLVKLYKEPIYELCGAKPNNGETDSPIDSLENNPIISDLDKLDSNEDNIDNTDDDIYETLDDVITSSPRHYIVEITSNCEVNNENKLDVVGDISSLCDKTSNLDELSTEDSLEDISNIDSCDSVCLNTIRDTDSKLVITDEYATVSKEKNISNNDDYATVSKEKNNSNDDDYATVCREKRTIVITDEYAVVNKENRPCQKSSESNELNIIKSSNDIYSDVSPNINNDTESESNTRRIVEKSFSSTGEQNIYSPVNVPIRCDSVPSKNIKNRNDYAEIAPLSTSLPPDQDNLVTSDTSENEYELLSNFKPSLSNTSTDNYTDIDDIPQSPEVTFNVEQIAYGHRRCSREGGDIFQSCLQTIEKSELLSQQTTKSKDKRNFFGFGKWKSNEDSSKSPSQSLPTDDLRKEPRLSSSCTSNHIPALCTGYLFKQGGTGFVPKNWRLRWFQLKKDNCLYYYKSEQDQIPIGAVILLKYQVSRATNLNKRFAFKISKGAARTYYFAANSEEEMKKWMGYLNDAARSAISDQTSFPECSLKNVSLPATSIADPDCHGFIHKQGNIHKTWKKRYCVLKYGCLFYYDDMTDKVAIGVFKLHRHIIHKSENTRYGFEAVPPVRKMRTYYFYTNTETETRRWMDAMKRSISSFQ